MQSAFQSKYPMAPMEYVNQYSSENVKSGRAPPPPPIIKEAYTCFGKIIDPNDVLIRSLESQGFQSLYKMSATASTDSSASASSAASVNTTHHKKELKKLNHSILIAYLDLLDILVTAPNTLVPLEEQPLDPETQMPIMKTIREQKLQDIELLFFNMHHLINELRPHQARDNIRCILELQKHQRMVIAQKFRSHLHKIVDLLQKCIQSIQTPSTNPNGAARMATFLGELNSLMKNANELTQRLGKFADPSDQNAAAAAAVEQPVVSENGGSAKSLEQQTQESSQAGAMAQEYENCDLNDVILCDLIDDFLVKKNEF